MRFQAYTKPTWNLHKAYMKTAKSSFSMTKKLLFKKQKAALYRARTYLLIHLQYLVLIHATKFSREFSAKCRTNNCRLPSKEQNSLENLETSTKEKSFDPTASNRLLP